MHTKKSLITTLTVSIVGIFLFTGCASLPPFENTQDSDFSSDSGISQPDTLKSVLNKIVNKPNSQDSMQDAEQTAQPTVKTFNSDEFGYSFEYPPGWTHISNWQGERGEIFVNNPNPDLFNDPRKNNSYLFIDHSNSYELVGWNEIQRKEMINKYGEEFKLNYFSPDEEYYIKRGITYLTPPQTETLITVVSDIIPGAVHYRYDSAKDELGEVGLMELLNSLEKLNN